MEYAILQSGIPLCIMVEFTMVSMFNAKSYKVGTGEVWRGIEALGGVRPFAD
jgi:hypothetical protein